MTVDNQTVEAGSTVSLLAGNYSLKATLCDGSEFLGWNATGGASVASASASVTTLSVTGNGSLVLHVATRSGTAGGFLFGGYVAVAVFLLLIVLVVAVAVVVRRRPPARG